MSPEPLATKIFSLSERRQRETRSHDSTPYKAKGWNPERASAESASADIGTKIDGGAEKPKEARKPNSTRPQLENSLWQESVTQDIGRFLLAAL
jgi:hypothetical protein